MKHEPFTIAHSPLVSKLGERGARMQCFKRGAHVASSRGPGDAARG